MKRAVRERFSTEDELPDIELAGRTDRHIARSILGKFEVDASDAAVDEFLEIYLRHLREVLPWPNGRVLPGVKEILDRIKDNPDLVLRLANQVIKWDESIK